MTNKQKQTATDQLKQLRKELIEIDDKNPKSSYDREILNYREINYFMRKDYFSSALAQLIINADIQ